MGRSPCCEDNNGMKKGPWTTEEDEKLVQYIQNHGLGSWRALPKLAGLNRCGKSCRLRWTNYLRPDIKRGKFSPEEEQTILHLHSIIGNKWSTIASHLPGRTDNEIKNYWNTHLKKRLIQMGFDPMTHQPRTDLFASLSNLIALANLSDLFQNLVDKQFLHNHNLIPQQQQQQHGNDAVIANLINSVLDTSNLKQIPEVSSTSHVVVENNLPEYYSNNDNNNNNNINNNNTCDYSQQLHHQAGLVMQSHHQNDNTSVNIIDTNNTTEQHQVSFSSQLYSLNNNNISTSDIGDHHHHRYQQDNSYACQRVGHGGDWAWFDDHRHLPIASSELSPSDHLPDLIELSDQYETSFVEANVYGSATSTTCNSWPQTSL